MTEIHPVFVAGVLPALRSFVMATDLHPILVNFTAALVPVSFFSDLMGRWSKSESLRSTGWWSMAYAAAITPLTIVTGWLFWMPDDKSAVGMTIHKWLGTGFIVPLLCIFMWRWSLRKKNASPPYSYFLLGVVAIGALIYQGYLGGNQVFSGM